MDELRVILARTEQRAQSASNNGLARAAAPVRGVSRLEVFFAPLPGPALTGRWVGAPGSPGGA